MEKKNVVSFRRGGEVTTLDLSFAGAGETTVVMVESIIYKYINGNLAQEYAANWKVESQNLPSGSTIKTSEVPSQLTITVPANNTSSTRSGKIVLLQPASQDEYLLIPVTKVPWSDNGSYTEPTAIFELYLKGSQLVPYSDFYFNMSLYDAQGLFYGCDREYSQAINYKIDTVDPSDWTPSGSYSHGSITVKKGNLSPSDFSGGILIELILGNKINGYVKRVMLRIKIN